MQNQPKNPQDIMERCCRRPWEAYMKPLRMAKGVYQISGNDWVACYLIDTGDGLILIDTAMHETVYLLLENMRQLGYKPTDIKKILISHAHIDHLGGARTLQELTGAQLYLGKRDVELLEDPRLVFAGDNYTCGGITPDAFYDDNRPITLGNVSIRTVSTPGHTPGCTSFFFNVTDVDGRAVCCAMHGGLGLNTLNRDYFNTYGQPASLRDEFVAGLKKLDAMQVDVCLPSHMNQADLFSDIDRVTDAFNPYVNPAAWHEMLQKRLQMTMDLIQSET